MLPVSTVLSHVAVFHIWIYCIHIHAWLHMIQEFGCCAASPSSFPLNSPSFAYRFVATTYTWLIKTNTQVWGSVPSSHRGTFYVCLSTPENDVDQYLIAFLRNKCWTKKHYIICYVRWVAKMHMQQDWLAKKLKCLYSRQHTMKSEMASKVRHSIANQGHGLSVLRHEVLVELFPWCKNGR